MFGGAIERDASGIHGPGDVDDQPRELVSVWLRSQALSGRPILSTRHFMREHNRLGVTSVVDAAAAGRTIRTTTPR